MNDQQQKKLHENIKHTLRHVFEQLQNVASEPSVYEIDEECGCIRGPSGVVIRLWNGSRNRYPYPHHSESALGVEVHHDRTKTVATLNRVYKFVSPQNLQFNAASAHKAVMTRVRKMCCAIENEQTLINRKHRNQAVAFCSLESSSVRPTLDTLMPLDHPPMTMRGKNWTVTPSKTEKLCTVTVTADVRPQDAGKYLRLLLEAQRNAENKSDFQLAPTSVILASLHVIPYVIEERLVIPEAITDKIHLTFVANTFAEWIDLASRAIEQVVEQMEHWENSIDDEHSHIRLQVRSARESVAQMSLEIGAVAMQLRTASLDSIALEDQLAPIRLALAKAHDKLMRVLAEL